jgi:hypothetical protein
MKVRTFVVASALAVTGVASFATGALADSPGSDAAHACLQGPQRDYYQVVGADDSSPPLNYHGLAHGADDSGQYILAGTHGDCVSFAADNTQPAQSISINYTKVEFVYNNQ